MVGNSYPPHHHGGYELVWDGAVEHLRAAGHQVVVLTTDTLTNSTEPDRDAVFRELRWHLKDGQFQQLGVRARAAMTRHNHAVLTRHLDAAKPHAVGWWSMGGLSLTMLEVVRRRGLPAVAFVHDEWLDYGQWADPWLRMFTGPRRARLASVAETISGMPTRVNFADAANYVFVSEFIRQHALSLCLGLKQTSVAHSGIHSDFIEPAPPSEWRWRLLYVGRIDFRKGIDTAIAGLSHLPGEATLTIGGSWARAEEARLRETAAELGVDPRVRFAGSLGRRELMAAYAEADAVVFPVRWNEPWGLVPLEAMARGRPVIATGTGGSSEYLRHGENCLLFEPNDEQALAAAVTRLADSPALRSRLREHGFETAPQYTEARFNQAVEEAFVEAVSRPAGSRAVSELAA